MEFEDGASRNSVRFVLLLHTLPEGSPRGTHWDLLIQQADALLSFALPALPPQLASQVSPASGIVWPAKRIADHRLRYLEYEGAIGPAYAGGPDRGSVRRLAAGWAMCQVLQQSQRRHRWQLEAAELRANFTYTPCEVGQTTQLHIESWQAASMAG